MKFQSLIKIGLALVMLSLCALIALKPTVNNEFHIKYLENLDALESMSGSLVRNHRLVRHGHIKHYDFLEADLQKMERFAQLALFPPNHIDAHFRQIAKSLSDDYLSKLKIIRDDVELSKRGIGLLNNSKSAVALLLKQLNTQSIKNGDNSDRSAVLANLVGLNQAFRDNNDFDGVRFLLQELTTSEAVNSQLIEQLQLHTNILDDFTIPVEKASDGLYKLTDALKQPQAIRSQYLSSHQAILATTTWLLWTSYALAALLAALAVLLSIFTGRAQRQSALAMQETENARKVTEQQILDSQHAVKQCNAVLSKVANGDFSERINDSFSDELEDLRLGVNQAADSVQFTMSELQRVLAQMQRGDFTSQLDDRVTGDFREQVESTNHRLQAIMASICGVMDQMKQGDFSGRVEMALEGSFDGLKSSVNESMIRLNQSLGEIAGIVDQQAHGDFNQRIQGEWPGELGTLSASLNRTTDIIHTMVKDIQQLSGLVTKVAHSVLENSEQLQSQSNQQAAAMNVALEASQKVGLLIDKNCKATKSASKLSVQSQDETSKCRDRYTQNVQTMKTVSEKIKQVSQITDTIESIASKTNLLALNAAVEACRAGETGKGFSVVAEEVKALARMSADASVNIDQIIKETGSQVRLGSSAAETAAKALEDIESSLHDVGEINCGIAEASQDQLKEMKSMTTSVNEAYELIRTNQTMASNTLSTSQELDDLAKKMSSLVAFFNVESEQHESLRKVA